MSQWGRSLVNDDKTGLQWLAALAPRSTEAEGGLYMLDLDEDRSGVVDRVGWLGVLPETVRRGAAAAVVDEESPFTVEEKDLDGTLGAA